MSSKLSLQKDRNQNKRLVLSARKWNELKEYVFYRDKWCVFCGSTDTATAAHVINKSQSGDDSPQNVVRACIPCHKKFDAYQLPLPEKARLMLENEPLRL